MIRHRRWILAAALLLSARMPADAQGIALPPVRRTGGEVVRETVVLPVQRADTISRSLPESELRTLRADGTLEFSGAQYRIIGVDRRNGRVRAVREYTVDEAVKVRTRRAGSTCELAGDGRYRGFPTLSKEQAECFWGRDGLTALNSASLSGSSEARAVAIDLASDFIGPVMAYVSASIAAADSAEAAADEGEAEEDREDVNVQRFLANGGNAVLGFRFLGPTFQTYGANTVGNPSFMAYAVLAPRIGFDVPSANSSVDNPKVNVDVGPELNLLAEGDRMAVFTQVRLAQVFGSPEFFESIGRGNESFGYGRINVGLRLNVLDGTRLLLTWSKPFSGPTSILRSGSQLQFTLQRADEDPDE